MLRVSLGSSVQFLCAHECVYIETITAIAGGGQVPSVHRTGKHDAVKVSLP